MRFTAIVLLTLALLLMFTASYAVTIVVDQSHLTASDGAHNLASFKFDQMFRPSISSLDVVEIDVQGGAGTILRLNIRQGGLTGPIVGTATASFPFTTAASGLTQFVFDNTLIVVSGNSYTIDLSLLSGSSFVLWVGGGGYTGGKVYIDGSPVNGDMRFQTGTLAPVRTETTTWGAVKALYSR